MISCFDASVLILLFDAKANAPIDPRTGKPVSDCQERVRYLLDRHAKTKGSRIVIPAPALAEFLVKTRPEKASEYISQLQRLKGCKIAPFAERAAIEFADLQRSSGGPGKRRAARDLDTRAKAKFDQQIVAIARAENASRIYSDDKGLAAYAKRIGIESIGIADLDLSPESKQGSLPLESLEAAPDRDEDL